MALSVHLLTCRIASKEQRKFKLQQGTHLAEGASYSESSPTCHRDQSLKATSVEANAHLVNTHRLATLILDVDHNIPVHKRAQRSTLQCMQLMVNPLLKCRDYITVRPDVICPAFARIGSRDCEIC